MSYPKQLRLFKAWARAMEEGATVGNPSYRGTGTMRSPQRPTGVNTLPRRKRRRRKRGKKTQD